jgi:transcriptional regulator with XRE-family HTH domain
MTDMVSEQQKIVSVSSESERQENTNLNSRPSLLRRLRRSKQAREQLVSSQIDKGIAYQIRALRDSQDLSQEQLAQTVGMNQNAISRLESPRYGRPTIRTLKRLAAAFDVALIVRFVPFSQLINWVSGTPYLEYGLSTIAMAAPNYSDEVQRGGLELVPQIVASVRTTTRANQLPREQLVRHPNVLNLRFDFEETTKVDLNTYSDNLIGTGSVGFQSLEAGNPGFPIWAVNEPDMARIVDHII